MGNIEGLKVLLIGDLVGILVGALVGALVGRFDGLDDMTELMRSLINLKSMKLSVPFFRAL